MLRGLDGPCREASANRSKSHGPVFVRRVPIYPESAEALLERADSAIALRDELQRRTLRTPLQRREIFSNWIRSENCSDRTRWRIRMRFDLREIEDCRAGNAPVAGSSERFLADASGS